MIKLRFIFTRDKFFYGTTGSTIIGLIGFFLTSSIISAKVYFPENNSVLLISDQEKPGVALFYPNTLHEIQDLTKVDEDENFWREVQLKINSVFGISSTASSVLTRQEMFYNLNPSFQIWTVLTSATVAVSFGVTPFLVFMLIIMVSKFKVKRYWVLISFILSIIIFGFIGFGPIGLSSTGFASIVYKTGILINSYGLIGRCVMASLVGCALTTALSFTIPLALQRLEYSKELITDDVIQRFNQLEAIERSSIGLLSAMITLGVLATAALRASILDAVPYYEVCELLPMEMVYSYGLFYTIFLVLTFLPIHHLLKRNGAHLNKCKNAFNESLSDNSNHVMESPRMEMKFTESLAVGVSILAPIISSFLPEQIGKLLGS